MTQDEVLSILRSTGALLHGHFELRSKLHSPEYFQCANLLRYPREAGRICEELAAKIPADIVAKATTVVSPALGGILVGHEVARALDKKCIFAEKQDGALVMRRFTIEPGERCIVAEDVACADVEKAIAESCKFVSGARLFDVYRGEQVGDGKKSMAFAVTFTPREKAISPEDADGYVRRILKTLHEKVGAELR